ncbi:hypothetical protein VNI00_010893 [Paramarasmius palmivorus]|uniref:Uncharacterized protein n=1 Tax=Paramarasmius palmivorus TaxID=297713 RepID=A0AAW0CET3_9AGAR
MDPPGPSSAPTASKAVVVGPSLKPIPASQDELERRRIKLVNRIQSLAKAEALAKAAAAGTSSDQPQPTFQEALVSLYAEVNDFVQNKLEHSESPLTRDARRKFEMDWRLFHELRSAAEYALKHGINTSPEVQARYNAVEIAAELAYLVSTARPDLLTHYITRETSDENLWTPALIEQYGCEFLVWKLKVSQPRNGRATIKSRTLLAHVALLTTCIVRYCRTPTSPNAGAKLLMEGGMYTTLRDSSMTLIRRYELDRYHDPLIFYDIAEVRMILAKLLALSDRKEATRVNKTMVCVITDLALVLALRPGTMGPSHPQYALEGKYPRVEDVRITKLGPGKFSLRLTMRNFKGMNGATGVSQVYVLESLELAHNITLCVVMYFIAYMFMIGYLDPKYKASPSINDVLDQTMSDIKLNPERLKDPLFPKGTPGGRGHTEGPLTAHAIGEMISEAALAVNLPGGGVYAIRHGAGNEWHDIAGKEGAKILLNHVIKDTFFGHYSKNTANYNWTMLRMGERKPIERHFPSRPQEDRTRAAVYAIISKNQRLAEQTEAIENDPTKTARQERLDKLWEQYLPTFNESSEHYLRNGRNLHTAQTLLAEAARGEASNALAEAGYEALTLNEMNTIYKAIANENDLAGQRKLYHGRRGGNAQDFEEREALRKARNDHADAILNLRASTDESQNDPGMQDVEKRISNAWTRFLPHFNDAIGACRASRDRALATKLVKQADGEVPQFKYVLEQFEEGVQWNEGQREAGMLVFQELENLYDEKKSKRRQTTKKLKKKTGQQIRDDYRKGFDTTYQEVQDTIDSLKETDTITTQILQQASSKPGESNDDNFDDEELGDWANQGSTMNQNLQRMFNLGGVKSTYHSLDEYRTEKETEVDVDGEGINMSSREKSERALAKEYMPELAEIPIAVVQREFLNYLVAPFERDQAIKGALNGKTGRYECPWCPIVPWHADKEGYKRPTFPANQRGNFKEHILISHTPWMELEREIEYEQDKFHCPSGDYDGDDLVDVRRHMLSNACKDHKHYAKMASQKTEIEADSEDELEQDEEPGADQLEESMMGVLAMFLYR